jgi:tyrosine-protein kinase Etk/Wzc
MHPEIAALDLQIARLTREVAAMTAQMARLPVVSKELERRARELKAETDLYYAVLQRLEELKVVSEDKSNNVHLVDEALVPDEPLGSRSTIILFAAVLGVILGVMGTFTRKMFEK